MIYLLHFSRPYHHARHYMGYTPDDRLETRLAEHRTGHGARLTRVVVSAALLPDLPERAKGEAEVMESKSWYIGYTDFEAFLKKAELNSPIYLMSIRKDTPTCGGRVMMETHMLTMQVINGTGVHYFRFCTGVFDRVVGAPELTPEEKQKRQASADCCELIRAWLNKAGFKTVEATVATPKDYTFLDAQMPFCLTFDKERWEFKLREEGMADANQ